MLNLGYNDNNQNDVNLITKLTIKLLVLVRLEEVSTGKVASKNYIYTNIERYQYSNISKPHQLWKVKTELLVLAHRKTLKNGTNLLIRMAKMPQNLKEWHKIYEKFCQFFKIKL